MNRRHLIALAAAAGLGQPSLAQSPGSPITLIVPFAAGDALDASIRAIAEFASQELKRPIIVENKAGASGSIGAEFVMRTSSPSTFLLGTAAMMSITPALRKTPYSSSDFRPVARLANIAQLVAVRQNFPANSWAEFVALAKKSPGKYSYGSPGEGTIGHLSMEAVQRMAGIKLLQIPYKGMAPALTDFVAGQIDIYPGAPAIPHIRAGTARALVVLGNERLTELPDVPSLKELGTPFDLHAWIGLFAPKAAPQELIDALEAAVQQAAARPELRTRMPQGVGLAFQPGKALQAQIAREQVIYRNLVSELKLKVE